MITAITRVRHMVVIIAGLTRSWPARFRPPS
jgi:hypothetical protein